MSRYESRLHPVDVAILGHLADRGIDYPTCIACQRGIDPATAKRRCEALADRGLVEPVSHEIVYRVTDAGVRTLEARDGRAPSRVHTVGDR